MADLQQLEQALLKAHAAGDTNAARMLAQAIAQQRSEQPPAQSPSSFGMGLADPIHGGAQLLTKALPTGVVQAGNDLNNWLADKTGLVAKLPEGGVDQQVREREKAYQQQRQAAGESGMDWMRLTGNVLSPANLAMASRAPAGASLMSRMLQGGASGSAAAALQPATADEEFAKEKARQVATGGVFGAATPAAIAGLGRVVSPQASVDPAVQALQREGVRPTIGQILGPRANALEEKLMSVPWLGDSIRNARARGAQDLEVAVGNRALQPLGQQMPRLSGRDAVEHVEQQLRTAYDALLPSLTVRADQQFLQQINSLRQMVSTGAMDPKVAGAFDRILQGDVLSKFRGQNALTGQTFKAIESDLGAQIRRFGQSPDADQRLLGDALSEAQDALRTLLERSNPQASTELRAINQGWANFKRMQRAASYVGADDGAFNPSQLQSAVKSLDRSKDKGAFARGNALMQDLSDPAKRVMGGKVPNSGTADRALLAGALAGYVEPTLAAGVLSGSALYSPAGQAALRALTTSRPGLAPEVARLLNQSSPVLGPAGGLLSLEVLE